MSARAHRVPSPGSGRAGSARAVALCVGLGLGLGLALLGAIPPAHAQDDLGRDAARDLYARGLECFDRGDHECAIAAWSAALRELGEDRGYRIHYNLGLAQEAAGHASVALDHYDRFLKAVAREEGALPPSLEERRQDAAERRRKLEGSGTTPPAPPPSATPAPPPAPSASPPPAPSNVTAPSPAPAPPPAARDEGASFPTAVVLIGVGLTGASLALPLVLRGEAEDRAEEARALGPGHTGYGDAVEAYDDARTVHDVSWILPISLAAATASVAVVGLVLVVQGGDRGGGSGARVDVGPGGARFVGAF